MFVLRIISISVTALGVALQLVAANRPVSKANCVGVKCTATSCNPRYSALIISFIRSSSCRIKSSDHWPPTFRQRSGELGTFVTRRSRLKKCRDQRQRSLDTLLMSWINSWGSRDPFLLRSGLFILILFEFCFIKLLCFCLQDHTCNNMLCKLLYFDLLHYCPLVNNIVPIYINVSGMKGWTIPRWIQL